MLKRIFGVSAGFNKSIVHYILLLPVLTLFSCGEIIPEDQNTLVWKGLRVQSYKNDSCSNSYYQNLRRSSRDGITQAWNVCELFWPEKNDKAYRALDFYALGEIVFETQCGAGAAGCYNPNNREVQILCDDVEWYNDKTRWTVYAHEAHHFCLHKNTGDADATHSHLTWLFIGDEDDLLKHWNCNYNEHGNLSMHTFNPFLTEGR